MSGVNFLRKLLSTWRGRLLVFGVLAVVALMVAGLIASARRAAELAKQPPSPISAVTPELSSLTAQPAMRWTFPAEQPEFVAAPVGGDSRRVLYALRDDPFSAWSLAVVRATTGERIATIGLGEKTAVPDCLVNDARALCAVGGPDGPELFFLDLDAGKVVQRVTGTGAAAGYPVGDGFLVWSPDSPPTRFRTDGTVVWRASGDSFVASPGAHTVYELHKKPGADGEGIVRSADDGRELVKITVKQGQQVRYLGYPGGFALERGGNAIRFFDGRGTALPGAVSAEGGQRLAAVTMSPVPRDDRFDAGLAYRPLPAAPVPVVLEERDDRDVVVVALDPAQKRNLWKKTVSQRDASKIQVWGVGKQVLVDAGAGHCYAFAAANGAGGAIPCSPVLGTDGENLAMLTYFSDGRVDTSAVVAYRPGDAVHQRWRVPLDDAAAFGGGLYGTEGRLS